MVILVTGGCGYLGSHLVREIAKKKEYEGETIRLIDNMFRDRFVSLFDLPSNITFELVHADVCDSDKVRLAMEDISAVFALSDLTNAPLSFERREQAYQTNYSGALNVYKAAIDSDVERFVYTSTCSVYGMTDGVADETSPCIPQSPYAEYKLKAESEMRRLSEEHSFNWIALRLGTVVGHSIGMRFDTVLNKFSYYASIGHPLTVWDTALREARPYVEIRDVSRAYLFAEQGKLMDGNIYNVVVENLTMDEVIEKMKHHFPQVTIDVTPCPDLNQASFIVSSDKIKRAGFKYQYSIDDGILNLAEKFSSIRRFPQ
jgi:UDP-glucose 4-epimerase